jgi:hypothetical protein
MDTAAAGRGDILSIGCFRDWTKADPMKAFII